MSEALEDLELNPKNDIVPMRFWGKDHWTTLMYLEHCAVDEGGVLDKQRMRCNPRLHRELANISPMSGVVDGSKYPTSLRNGETIAPHDDWSCVEDMVAYGLVEVEVDYNMEKRAREGAFGHADAVVTLTDEGRALANQLRELKSKTGLTVGDLKDFAAEHMENPGAIDEVIQRSGSPYESGGSAIYRKEEAA